MMMPIMMMIYDDDAYCAYYAYYDEVTYDDAYYDASYYAYHRTPIIGLLL